MSIEPKLACKKCNGTGTVTVDSISKVSGRKIQYGRPCSCIIVQVLREDFIEICKIADTYKKPPQEDINNVAEVANGMDPKEIISNHWWIDTSNAHLNYVFALNMLKGMIRGIGKSTIVPRFISKTAMTLLDHFWSKGNESNILEVEQINTADIIILEFTAKAKNQLEPIAFLESLEKYIGKGKKVWLLYNSSDGVFSNTNWYCPQTFQLFEKLGMRWIGKKWDGTTNA
jgi:hypothetical protein